MSFLGSIVNSIGGERAPPPPQKPLNRTAPSHSARPLINSAKNTAHPGTNNLPAISTGLKRKAEDDGSQGSAKTSRSNTPSTTISSRGSPSLSGKQLLQKPAVSSSASKSKPSSLQTSQSLGTNLTTASKPPQKGSYAEMMARAKQSAEQHAQSQVGTIKHQETKREKMSRLAEKRKTGHDKSKESKPAVALKKEDRAVGRGSTGSTKSDTIPSAKPKATAKPTYKGTMGLGASQSRPQKSAPRKSRYDEYLGTDEEEEDDDDEIIDDDDDGYGSEGSSVMEAGFDDMEDEEEYALKAAKEDDARELARENQLKREKEERRKKLIGLARKQR